MSTPTPIKVSASRLKTLQECSLRFWYSEIERLPQSTHPKALTGTGLHLAFECLMHPRRLVTRTRILTEGVFRISEHPSVARLLRRFCAREGIGCDLDEYGAMLHVAFLGIRDHYLSGDPPTESLTEHRFQLSIGEGVISGFIDLLLLWRDAHGRVVRALVADLKSAGAKFVRAEVPSNIQAAVYQLSVRQEYGVVPPVDFIMVRHPPGPRSPKGHIQRTDPLTESQLAGLSSYIEDTYRTVNQFTLEEALANPSRDEGFCSRICPHLRPFSYWALVPESAPSIATPLKTGLDSQPHPPYTPGTRIVRRHHPGCLARWRQ